MTKAKIMRVIKNHLKLLYDMELALDQTENNIIICFDEEKKINMEEYETQVIPDYILEQVG